MTATRNTRRRAAVVAAALGGWLLLGCTAGDPAPGAPPTPPGTPAPGPPGASRPTPTPSPTPAPEFSADAALADVEWLAGDIGPRLATDESFARAADEVSRRLLQLGYDVDRPEFDVPAGDSWGTPVAAGTSSNVIAQPATFDPDRDYVIIGAHLDTIAVSPGAEDNASGVAVLLELARLAASQDLQQVRFIAFGAEEPRGRGDDDHHYGSQRYVADLGSQGDRMVAMIALDRVGVPADEVPICTGGPVGSDLRDELLDVAAGLDIAARGCEGRTSDHWSFEKAGLPAARFGSVDYAGYHSRRDTPDVVDEAQLGRVGEIVWAWLADRP